MSTTWRTEQKANRRAEILRTAAELFAQRGYASVSTVELGEAVGMSGPALYKHFPSKEALLGELLIDASTHLSEGGRRIVEDGDPPVRTLDRLIGFHIGYTTTSPAVIRVQDRELAQLSPEANRTVRALQRSYVQDWDAVLARVRPELDSAERQIRVLGCFGLLNSTPYFAQAHTTQTVRVLTAMARDALRGSGTPAA